MGSLKSISLAVIFLTVAALANAKSSLPGYGYTPAKLIKEVRAIYPVDKFRDGSETSIDDGQIEVQFVVDKQGSAIAPMVIRTSMDKFVQPTLLALEGYRYEPATLNGEPVASVQSRTFYFQYTAADAKNARGASSSFTNTRDHGVPDGYQSYYDQFTEEMAREEPSQLIAKGMLDRMIKLKHQSFYSLAYHGLARFRFAEKFQGSKEKIAALKDLVWFDPQIKIKHQILKGDLKDAIWTNLLKQQIEVGHYAESLQTFDKIAEFRNQGELPFADAIAQITAIKSNDQVVQRLIEISERGFEYLPLLKNSLTFIDVEGELSSLTLRCEARFAEIPYQADAQYELPEKWGACYLQVFGDVGTTAKLLLQ